jgi:hypothetical protein
MEALKELLRKFTKLDQKKMWYEIMSKPQNKQYVINLIQRDQLRAKGVNEFNKVIGYYSPLTQMINPKKKAGSHYTLEDTGAFFRSFYVKVGKTYIEIDANSLKFDEETGEITDLFKEYGTGIIGLTDESKTKLANRIVIDAKVILKNLLLQP